MHYTAINNYINSGRGKDQEITEAYNRLRESTNIGSQYDWLARFAKNIEGLCMSLEKSSKSKALACITKYGDIKLQREGKLDFYMIDSHKSSSDLIKVFGRFRFPYIVWTKTKSEAAEDFKNLDSKMHCLRLGSVLILLMGNLVVHVILVDRQLKME